MPGVRLAIYLALALCSAESRDNGALRGVVVNATRGGVPSAQTQVVLRVQIDGQFVPAAGTVTDERGRFEFTELPVASEFVYLPGANQDEVHYPGPRVRLSATQPAADVRLEVCDVVRYPSPLVIDRQDVLIQPEPGLIRVTESLLIRNPTATTYVGQAANAEAIPVTLALAIPPDFERTTFHKEFFGRNFVVVDGKVATGIPWTPGEREVVFTYTLRNEDRHRVWQRPVDLPCRQLRVRVQHSKPDEVSCNLHRAVASPADEIAFDARGKTLPAGQVIRVELGRLPVAWTRYGRWAALALLVGSIAAAGVIAKRGQARRLVRAGSRSHGWGEASQTARASAREPGPSRSGRTARGKPRRRRAA